MRLSGFMLGSLLGAAAMVYAVRKRPGMVALAANAMTDIGSSLVNKSMSKMKNVNWNMEDAGFSPKRSDDTAAKSAAGLEGIEAVVNDDPAVKREVDKIMAESSSISH